MITDNTLTRYEGSKPMSKAIMEQDETDGWKLVLHNVSFLGLI